MIWLDVSASTVHMVCDTAEEVVHASVALMEGLKSKNPQAHIHNQKIDLRFSEPMPYWHVAFDESEQTFPRGLLLKAAVALHNAKLSYQVRSVERLEIWLSEPTWNTNKGDLPRDYQMEAARVWALSGFGTVVIPTRGGKTLVGCLVASMVLPQADVLWLVTKNEALRDVQETWEQQKPSETFYNLTVMTYARATRCELTGYGLVIADEVHRTAADTYYSSLQSATNAWYRLGLTGTPTGRSDGKEIYIEGAVGPIVFEVSRKLLIERGFCSSGVTWRVNFPGPVSMPPDVVGNWTQIEKYGIAECAARDEALIRAAKLARGDSNDQILFLCRRKVHAEALATRLSKEFGVEVPAMHSGRTKKQRMATYETLASGKCTIAVATSIYDDSMTFPHLKILVVAAGGKSSILTGQRMGRVLAGDKKITIIDISDDHWPTLKSHAKKRFRVYEKEGYPIRDIGL